MLGIVLKRSSSSEQNQLDHASDRFSAPTRPEPWAGAQQLILLKQSLLLMTVLLVCCCQLSCVHRRLTIRSNPPGALVYVDGQEIGFTPVSTPFVYYGTRSIRLEMDGYEIVEQMHRIRAPWYQIPPIDFVSENLSFRDIRDERVLDFQLVPMQIVPTGRLLDRANNLRRDSQMGLVTPLPAANALPPGEVAVPAPGGGSFQP